MHWAKTRSAARFNLAISGVGNLSLSDLGVSLSDIDLAGEVGYGYGPLREALANRYRVQTENVVAATGTSLANHLAMATLIDPGDEVLIERPGYEPLVALAEYLGADVKRFDRRFEDGFQLTPAEVKRHLTARTRLIVVTNLHNPSSVLSSDDTLRQIGELAKENHARVLVDEVYLEALFEAKPRTAFHLGNEFVITNSLTKIFGLSGLRAGWILAEAELAEKIWLLNDLFGVNAAHPAEQLSVVALKQLDRIAVRVQRLLETNRLLLTEFLGSCSRLEVVRSEWGTVVFPRLKKGSVDSLCELLRDRYETSIVPGRFFEMPQHFRIGICGDSEALVSGLERLGRALDQVS
jgi:hypothetical protein